MVKEISIYIQEDNKKAGLDVVRAIEQVLSVLTKSGSIQGYGVGDRGEPKLNYVDRKKAKLSS